MLARDRRIRRTREFAAIWRSRWVVRHPALTVRVVANPKSAGRVGFVVSKTVSKKAVDRNKIKRRLRAIFQHHDIPTGLDIAFIAGRPALVLTFSQLTDVVHQLLNRALASPRRDHRH